MKRLIATMLCLSLLLLCSCGNAAGSGNTDNDTNGKTKSETVKSDGGGKDADTIADMEWPVIEEQVLLDCSYALITASNMTYDPSEGLMFDVNVANKTDDCILRTEFGSFTLCDDYMPWQFTSAAPGEDIHARIGANPDKLQKLFDQWKGADGLRDQLKDLDIYIHLYVTEGGKEKQLAPYGDASFKIISSYSDESPTMPNVALSEQVIADTDDIKVTLTGDKTFSTSSVMGAKLIVENKTDSPIGFRAAFSGANGISVDASAISSSPNTSFYDDSYFCEVSGHTQREYTALAFMSGLVETGVNDIGSLRLQFFAETPMTEDDGSYYYVGRALNNDIYEIKTGSQASTPALSDGTVLYDKDGVKLECKVTPDKMIIYAADESDEYDITIRMTDSTLRGGEMVSTFSFFDVYPGYTTYDPEVKKTVRVFDPYIIPDRDATECVLTATLEIKAYKDLFSEGTALFQDTIEIPVIRE